MDLTLTGRIPPVIVARRSVLGGSARLLPTPYSPSLPNRTADVQASALDSGVRLLESWLFYVTAIFAATSDLHLSSYTRSGPLNAPAPG